MKLSEYSKNQTNESVKSSRKKSVSESYNELKNCSADELMQRLAKEIQSQKTSGTFDYQAIMASIEQIKPYLPTQTYENMIRIIENLK